MHTGIPVILYILTHTVFLINNHLNHWCYSTVNIYVHITRISYFYTRVTYLIHDKEPSKNGGSSESLVTGLDAFICTFYYGLRRHPLDGLQFSHSKFYGLLGLLLRPCLGLTHPSTALSEKFMNQECVTSTILSADTLPISLNATEE